MWHSSLEISRLDSYIYLPTYVGFYARVLFLGITIFLVRSFCHIVIMNLAVCNSSFVPSKGLR
jgi:hypothetical protein